jgi:hypothetical protein
MIPREDANMPNQFAAYKVVQNPPTNISAYLIESTAPDNIDEQFVTHTLYDQIECLTLDTAIDQIADTLANADDADDPTLVVSVHGFNNPRDVILPTYKDSFDCVINDGAINNRKVVCIGYRWPSERMGAPTRTALRAAPWFLLGLLISGMVFLLVAIIANIPHWLTIVIVVFGVFALAVSITAILLRIIVYFRDGYRATSFGVPELVEIIRQIDTKAKAKAKTRPEHWVRLSFMGHSMGAYVVTGAVRILSDVFDPSSISLNPNETKPFKKEGPSVSSDIGKAFRLMQLVLVSPDIPAEALILNRANFLAASLRRFHEAFLFSNEGDEVLRQISTMANYFSFPTRSRNFGYRLGNVGVLKPYGLFRDVQLQDLRVGYMTLQELYDKLGLPPIQPNVTLPPQVFSYFDCTDCIENNKGVVTLAKPGIENKIGPLDHLRLLISYAWNRHPNVHGGYFQRGFLSQLIYGLVCIGYQNTEASYGGFRRLNTECHDHQIKALLKS